MDAAQTAVTAAAMTAAAGTPKPVPSIETEMVKFQANMTEGIANIRDGVLIIRACGIAALQHCQKHHNATMLSKWLDRIAGETPLPVNKAIDWVKAHGPLSVSGLTAAYDKKSDVEYDIERAKMVDPFVKGPKVEKPVDDFSALELIQALQTLVTRYEGAKKHPKDDDAVNMLSKAGKLVTSLH